MASPFSATGASSGSTALVSVCRRLSVPDEYLCEQCEPRPVDVAFAQAQSAETQEQRGAEGAHGSQSQTASPGSRLEQLYPELSCAGCSAFSSSTTHPLPSSVATEDTLTVNQQPAHLTSTSATTAQLVRESQASSRPHQYPVRCPSASCQRRICTARCQTTQRAEGLPKGFDTPSSVSTPSAASSPLAALMNAQMIPST